MAKYRIADMINGDLGAIYENLETAEKALNEEIAYWQKEDEKLSEDELNGVSVEQKKEETATFFCIVDAYTGEEVYK